MSAGHRVTLTEEKETLLITLFAKAGESALPDSLLRDRFAAEAVKQIDYDFSRLKVDQNLMVGMGLRAYAMDTWVREFIAKHPSATVLHLGCGLDTRVFRVDPPASVRWFDVDYPDVVALRRQLYPERASYRLLGTSVTELQWLSEVPTDQPCLVIAEGLTMYLSRDEVQRLFTAITDAMPSGEVDMDAFSKTGVKMVQKQKSVRATGAVLKWGTDDAHELEQMVPKLTLVAEVPAYDPAQIHRFSFGARIGAKLMLLIPAMRRLGRFLRYRF